LERNEEMLDNVHGDKQILKNGKSPSPSTENDKEQLRAEGSRVQGTS